MLSEMTSYLALTAFIFARLKGMSCQTPCPSGWQISSDSSCLQFNNQFQLSWSQADLFCRNQGSTLTRFSDYDDRQNFINVAMGQPVDGWWTGLNDNGHTDVWTWGTDEQVTPGALAWSTEPTDSHHVENCVSIETTGLLSDDLCSRSLGYICSYNLPPGSPTCSDGFINAGGTCYYISHLEDTANILSWQNALAACGAFNPPEAPKPSLAVFTSADQFNELQSLIGNVSPGGKRWVGLNDQATEGVWAWADGTVAADTTFLEWLQFPLQNSDLHCGLAHSNALVEQDQCSELHYFVCEKYIHDTDVTLAASTFGCPAPWLRAGSKCYFFNTNLTLDNPSARTFCQGIKGDLLKVESMDEKDWVGQQTILLRSANLWTGLRRATDNSDTWVWADGSAADSLTYDWNQEPNNDGGGEDCAYLTSDGVYNDASCYLTTGFICEMTSEDAPCPSGWASRNGPDFTSCYYVSNNTRGGQASWQEAQNMCQQLAGRPDAHLVAIETQDEFDYVKSLFQNRPWAGYWTDLTDTQVEGVWAFSKQYEGDPPAIPWGREPNNVGGHENCAVMYYAGKYNDVTCESSASVACERPIARTTSISNVGSTQAAGSTPLLKFFILLFIVFNLSSDTETFF